MFNAILEENLLENEVRRLERVQMRKGKHLLRAAEAAFTLEPTSVTRLGDLLHFGQPFKAFGNN